MSLVCHVNAVSAGTTEELRVGTANRAKSQSFSGGHSIQTLRDSPLRRRTEALCRSSGHCKEGSRKIGIDRYAELVTTALNVASLQSRAVENAVWKLLASRTGNGVMEADLGRLVKLAIEKPQEEEFADLAQRIFSGAGLFFYQRYPKGSTVVCFGTP